MVWFVEFPPCLVQLETPGWIWTLHTHVTQNQKNVAELQHQLVDTSGRVKGGVDFDFPAAVGKNKNILRIWELQFMGVSKNKGTPKWMVYNGKPY